jgi:uncharacterized protein (DUF58 family)
MSVDQKPRSRRSRGWFRRLTKGLIETLWPREGLSLTREGFIYVLVSILLLFAGLWQQVNLILLVFTLTAGPFLASIFGGRSMLRRLRVLRRISPYVFSGDPLIIDYTLENGRRWHAALALFLGDTLVPVDRLVSGAATLTTRVFFARVAGQDRARVRWQSQSPKRGKYRFRDLDLGTRSPFGFVEHRVTIPLPDQIVVYPKIGYLSRRWFQMQRQATENRRGLRHDRSAQQVEYHGLRDYRSGDSPRWIHWRTSARRGELMVKEFEQQNEQDLAILVDPWLPRARVGAGQREALEEAISFAATICLETCRHQGRRLALGWTGPTPGVRQGPASVKLLHEFLAQLAMMRPSSEGGLAELFDAMPPAILREAHLIILSTRPLNLIEEAERSSRLSGTSARGLLSRAFLLNATQGDLTPLFQNADDPSGTPMRNFLQHRLSSALQERLSGQGPRRRGLDSEDEPSPGTSRTTNTDGEADS